MGRVVSTLAVGARGRLIFHKSKSLTGKKKHES